MTFQIWSFFYINTHGCTPHPLYFHCSSENVSFTGPRPILDRPDIVLYVHDLYCVVASHKFGKFEVCTNFSSRTIAPPYTRRNHLIRHFEWKNADCMVILNESSLSNGFLHQYKTFYFGVQRN